MKPRTKRFALIAAGIVVLCAAAAFVLNAFQSNLVFFFTPTQVSKGEAPKGRTFRAGGMVKEGSLVRDNAAAGGGNTVRFVITDTVHEMPVTYVGLLPDLFKEGKGVVAQGKLGDDGVLWPAKCWLSTMKTTCRPKPNMRWIRRLRPKPPSLCKRQPPSKATHDPRTR